MEDNDVAPEAVVDPDRTHRDREKYDFISVVGTFCAAHRLKDHKGKCSRIHGHTYEVKAHLQRTKDSIDNEFASMVLDFAEAKRILGDEIKYNWDHRFFIGPNDYKLSCLFCPDIQEEMGIVRFSNEPTVENFARAFLGNLNSRYLRETEGKIECFAVEVFESASTAVVAARTRPK